MLRQFFIHDGGRWGFCCVRGAKGAAAHDVDPRGVKVVLADRIGEDIDVFFPLLELKALGNDCCAIHLVAKGDGVGERRRFDPDDGARAFHQLLEKLLRQRFTVTNQPGVEAHRQKMICAEARILAQLMVDASKHESGHSKKHQRNRHLSRDQEIAA